MEFHHNVGRPGHLQLQRYCQWGTLASI
jgi:hypothetical protein